MTASVQVVLACIALIGDGVVYINPDWYWSWHWYWSTTLVRLYLIYQWCDYRAVRFRC